MGEVEMVIHCCQIQLTLQVGSFHSDSCQFLEETHGFNVLLTKFAYGVFFGVRLLLKFDFLWINTILTIIFLNCFGDVLATMWCALRYIPTHFIPYVKQKRCLS